MAALQFNEAELVQKIGQLPKSGRVAFAAASAERLLPAYSKFAALTGRGNPQVLNETLALLWNDVGGEPMSEAEVDERIEFCMGLIPKEDEGTWVEEQAAAEDAGAAVTYALRCRKNGQAQEAVWAARRAYEALDHYVINREGIDTNATGAEARVLEHPLIQAEIERQQRDFEELLNGTITVDQLRERAKAEALVYLPQ